MKTLFVVGLAAAVVIAAIVVNPQPFLVTKTERLTSVADAHVNSQNLNTNYGSLSFVTLHHYGSPPSNDFLNRTFIRFDYTQLTGTVQDIQQATLRLPMYSCRLSTSNQKSPDLEVWRINSGGFTESTVTWNTQPTDIVGPTVIIDLTPQTCPAANTVFTADLTSHVSTQVSGSNFGFSVVWDDESNLASTSDVMVLAFSSREGGSPEMEIQYTSPGEEPPPGVGPGTNNTTQNVTAAAAPNFGFAALIFIVVFILMLIVARRRPGLAVVLGTIAGAVAAGGYLLLGGG